MIDVLKANAIAQHAAAERAVRHYINSLTLHPTPTGGTTALGGGLRARSDIRLRRPPGALPAIATQDPMLRGQLAACLTLLDRNPDALGLCDRAVEMAPNHAEFYRTRAIIRANLGQADGSAHDIDQFEMLDHLLPVDPLWSADLAYSRDDHHGPKYLAELAMEPWSSRLGIGDESGDHPPEDIDFRLRLSEAIHKSGDYVGARAELDRTLAFEPDHLPTRMKSVEYAIDAHQFDAARRDLEAILNHPGLLDHLRKTPDRFVPLFLMTYGYLKSSRVADAQLVAQRAAELAGQIGRDLDKCQYNLAQVYAVKGRTDTRFIKEAADQLSRAFVACPYLRQWYQDDSWYLNSVRVPLDVELRRIEGSTAGRPRLVSNSTARTR